MRCAHISIGSRGSPLKRESIPEGIAIKWKVSAEKETSMKSEREGINLNAKPSGSGCLECLATDGWWLHLRRCAECGHIGCCDSSPSQHASKHNATSGHPIINSFEPGEEWFYDYRTQKTFDGPAQPSVASGESTCAGTRGPGTLRMGKPTERVNSLSDVADQL
jgi:hypothetical protein